jgi:hypothetical protein
MRVDQQAEKTSFGEKALLCLSVQPYMENLDRSLRSKIDLLTKIDVGKCASA